ncbi:MAG: T9SS type A sorting domain-containing protein, partial [Ignavibacteriae bacterium]|nr:T9SS type A sorting domain-containing protein [Ignavibacteriota bacterium]
MLVDTVAVDTGWNIIGSISNAISVNAITSIPSGIVLTSYYGYGVGYTPSDTVEPGKGYWVKVSKKGKLILNSKQVIVSKSNTISLAQQFESKNRLMIQDGNGKTQILYFGTNERDSVPSLSYELPPLPPSGIFDARFSSGNMFEGINEGEKKEVMLSLSSAKYPLTISWELKSNAMSAILKSGEKEIRLVKDGTTTIAAEQTPIKLLLEGTPNVPKEFALEQNYPNPFNPVTVIRYQLPVDATVTLKVFNVLGQEVKTLVDETQDAGYMSVEWNAGNFASGVYFYRLEAVSASDPNRSFADVKKLLLLR